MRIGMFADSFLPIYDGVGRVMKAYADNLSGRGHEVYVITALNDTGYRGTLGYEILDFKSFRVSKSLPYRSGFPRKDKHLMQRLDMIDFDILHIHDPAMASRLALRIAKERHIPCVGSFHTKFYDEIRSATGSKLVARAVTRNIAKLYSKCSEVWAVASGTKQTLIDYGCSKDLRIRIMPNGTDIRTLDENMVPDVISKYGIRRDVPVFMFVGRINWNKNIRMVVDALEIYKSKGHEFQFVFVGAGPDFEDCSSYVKSKGLDCDVKMIGFVDDCRILDCLYSVATLMVFPSIFDNSPLAVREAAAMRLPSLVVAGSCSSEGIDDMRNGVLVDNSPESIAAGMERFAFLSDSRRHEICDCAFQTIPKSWSDIAGEVESIYAELIGARC